LLSLHSDGCAIWTNKVWGRYIDGRVKTFPVLYSAQARSETHTPIHCLPQALSLTDGAWSWTFTYISCQCENAWSYPSTSTFTLMAWLEQLNVTEVHVECFNSTELRLYCLKRTTSFVKVKLRLEVRKYMNLRSWPAVQVCLLLLLNMFVQFWFSLILIWRLVCYSCSRISIQVDGDRCRLHLPKSCMDYSSLKHNRPI